MYKNDCVDYTSKVLKNRVTVQDIDSFLSHTKISQDDLESIKRLMRQLKKVQLQYFKNQIYINSVKEVVDENELKSDIALKTRRILNFHNVDSFIKLKASSSSKQLLLGLTTASIQNLSYEEGLFIKELLENKIKKKHSSCTNILKKYGKNMDTIELFTTNLLDDDFEIFKLKVKFDDLKNIYIECLLKLTTILQEFLNIRLSSFYEQSIKLHENLNANKTILDFKSKILTFKLKEGIFNCTSLTKNAYKTAQKDLSNEKEKLSSDIAKLQKEFDILSNMSNNPELAALFTNYIHILNLLKIREHLIK